MSNNLSKTISIQRILLITGVALLIFVTLFPFFWILRTSLTPNKLIYTNTTSLLPPELTLSNFKRVLGLIDSVESIKLGGSGQSINLMLNIYNSFIVSTFVMFFQVLCSGMAAYAFARLEFKFKNPLFSIYLSALMIPGIVVTIPNFVFIKELGALNTLVGIMAPTLLMTPFAVFFLRQFFLGINRSLEEAAFLDGASTTLTFFKIIVPLSQTAFVTIAVITFITTWNDYMWPLLIGKSMELRTLTVALGIFRSQTPQGSPDWGGLMAGAVIAVIPSLAILIAFGRKIVDSIGFSGVK